MKSKSSGTARTENEKERETYIYEWPYIEHIRLHMMSQGALHARGDGETPYFTLCQGQETGSERERERVEEERIIEKGKW